MASAPSRSPTSLAKDLAARARTERTAASASASSLLPHLAFGLQAGGLALGVLQRSQPKGALLSVGHDGRQVLAVLAPQLGQQAPALLHVDEPLRVVLPALDLVAQGAGQVGQLDGGGGQAARVALERLAAGQGATGATEQVDRPALAGGVDQLQRLERGVTVGGGVGQPILLEPQGGLLVGIVEVGLRDLLHLVAEDVRLAGPLLGVAAESGQRLVERVQLAPDGPHAAEIRAGEGVEHVALRGGRDEGPVLVLAVDLDQLRRRLAERAEGRHAAVDPGPGAALGGDRAGQDHLAGGVALPHHEAGLDQGLGRAGAHHAGVGPTAQHQLQRLDDQRLAGARLSGERRHAGPELQRQVLDHAEVAHVQVGQHDRLTRSARPEAGSAGCRRRSAARSARHAPGARPRCT